MNILISDIDADTTTLMNRAEALGFSSIVSMDLHNEWVESISARVGIAAESVSLFPCEQHCFVDMQLFDPTADRLEV